MYSVANNFENCCLIQGRFVLGARSTRNYAVIVVGVFITVTAFESCSRVFIR